MRCPKCGIEVGNRSVCPFCGGTVYVSTPTWPAGQAAPTVSPEQYYRNSGRHNTDSGELRRYLQLLETKINLLLVLGGGIFALMLLILVVMLIL